MIRCEVIEDFRLESFDELQNIIRKNNDTRGKLYEGDTFECTQKMAEYLTGKNPLGKEVVRIIEIIPAKEEKETDINAGELEEAKEEENEPSEKITRKNTSKKAKE